MKNKVLEGIYCPMTYNNPDENYHNWCIESHCAWWVTINVGNPIDGDIWSSRCAIAQLARKVNCEADIYE